MDKLNVELNNMLVSIEKYIKVLSSEGIQTNNYCKNIIT